MGWAHLKAISSEVQVVAVVTANPVQHVSCRARRLPKLRQRLLLLNFSRRGSSNSLHVVEQPSQNLFGRSSQCDDGDVFASFHEQCDRKPQLRRGDLKLCNYDGGCRGALVWVLNVNVEAVSCCAQNRVVLPITR